jgi:hypothetical protein
VGIYGKYKSADFDFSQNNPTLLFCQAHEKQDFSIYQNLGDWLFYTKSMFPASLKNASENYYNNIAQLSYYNCYRIVKGWKVYEELADQYVHLIRSIRNILIKNNLIDYKSNQIGHQYSNLLG